MTARRHLSAADAAWLHMERPENLMNITGLLQFEHSLSLADVQILAERLARHELFRCRVEESATGPTWVSEAGFDLSPHLREVTAPNGLMALVGDLLGSPLERSRPLWDLHLVHLPAGSAVVVRLHHALGDGVAMMHVLGTLADVAPPHPAGAHGRVRPGPAAWLRGSASLVRRVLLRPEPITGLKGPLGRRKLAAVSPAISLDEVKRIGRALGATVNDVLLAALAGALRSYLGTDDEELTLRMVMPVDLRRTGDERLGNRFGLVFVELPVGLREPRERLAECKRRLDELKDSPQAVLVYALLQLAGRLPVWGEGLLVDIFGARATAVATNVPGPRQPLLLGGRPVRQIMFWVPQSGRLGLGVSILSYAGEVRVGIAADAGLIPDPGLLVAEYAASFAQLAQLAG